MSSHDDEGHEKVWIRSRPTSAHSYREGTSRGSQTSASDLGDNDIVDIRPLTPSVRKSSLILGDLRALYAATNNPNVLGDLSAQLRPNKWSKLFESKVLAELKEICRLRQIDDEKCMILTGKRNRRALELCFTCWRGSLVRVIKRDLVDSIERKATGYFRQRKKSVIQVWGHMALGLHSKKNILERRRGGLDRARESLLKRLEEKGDNNGMIITPDMIEAEIRRLVYRTLSVWMDKSSIKTCFTSWRDYLRQHFKQTIRARKHHVANAKKKVLLTWLLHVREYAQHVGGSFVNYERLGEADLYSHRRLINRVMMIWRQYTKSLLGSKKMRRKMLSRLARKAFFHWQTAKNSQRQTKERALVQWRGIETVYMKEPFKVWRSVVENNKCRMDYEKRLVDTHLRYKRRRSMHKLFRQWLHQARYGRITSSYSRNHLARGWLENKRRCEQLSSRVVEMQSKVDDYDLLVAKVKTLEEALMQSEESLLEMKKKNECLARINPVCADQVLALFPLFGHTAY